MFTICTREKGTNDILRKTNNLATAGYFCVTQSVVGIVSFIQRYIAVLPSVSNLCGGIHARA